MHNQFRIPLTESNYLSQLSKDFLLGNDIGIPNPNITKYSQLIDKAKSKEFDSFKRTELTTALLNQYQSDGIPLDENSKVFQNIQSLQNSNCFTITTGQQIHIFLGPLFFLHKIFSLISHVKNFNTSGHTYKAVPVFWMASEDHDLEEINHVKLYSETYSWNAKPGNAVGRLMCDGLHTLIDQLEQRADKSVDNSAMFALFREHYSPEKTLAAATRSILNSLFAKDGLIIINPDDAYFKKQFSALAKQEIEGEVLFNTYNEENKRLKNKGYKPRVNAVALNYFWLADGERTKIKAQKENETLQPKDWLLQQLNNHSYNLSPNVIARPLFQEFILPNIAYIGGSAEIEYWLPLQKTFECLGLQFPALLIRDSFIYLSQKNADIIKSYDLKWEYLFLNDLDISDLYVKEKNLSLNETKARINEILQTVDMLPKAFDIDKKRSVEAIKTTHELNKGLCKLLKILEDNELERQKSDPELKRIFKIKENFFDVKQERENFCLSYPKLFSNIFKRDIYIESQLRICIL